MLLCYYVTCLQLTSPLKATSLCRTTAFATRNNISLLTFHSFSSFIRLFLQCYVHNLLTPFSFFSFMFLFFFHQFLLFPFTYPFLFTFSILRYIISISLASLSHTYFFPFLFLTSVLYLSLLLPFLISLL